MKQTDYLNILQETGIQESGHFGYQFVDDNAPIHRTRSVIDWKQYHSVQAVEWSPRSPDLNQIENVWGIIKNK